MSERTDEKLAGFYRVSSRTIARIKADGVDLLDPLAVAAWLATRRSANPVALERAVDLLELPEPQ